MEIDWNTHVLVGDTILDTFTEYVNSTVKKIKEQSKEPECAIKEHLISEIEYELNKMKKELDYEEADFFARSGDSGEDE